MKNMTTATEIQPPYTGWARVLRSVDWHYYTGTKTACGKLELPRVGIKCNPVFGPLREAEACTLCWKEHPCSS